MKRTKKSKESFFSDVHFLFELARRFSCRIRLYTMLVAVLTAAVGIGSWLLLPLVIRQVETNAPLPLQLTVIAVLTATVGLLAFALSCAEGAFAQSRDAFRTRGSTQLVKRSLTRSYEQITHPDHAWRLEHAARSMGKHIHAPIPHMWRTISDMSVHAVGVLVFGGVLCKLPLYVVAVSASAAIIRAVVHRAVSIGGARYETQEAVQDDQMAYVSRVCADASMSADIRVFSLAPWLRDIHDTALRAVRCFIDRRAKLYVLYNAADALTALLMNGAAFVSLFFASSTESLPLSLFVLYFSAVGRFSYALSDMFTLGVSLSHEAAALRDYRDYMTDQETADGCVLPSKGGAHTLALCDVSFRYPSSDKPVLDRISLTLHAGEKLAVVGEDGAGKTALSHLLCGLYDPHTGTVLFDGIDVKTFDRRAYHRLFSTVFENSSLFGLSVLENVAGTPHEADEARVWRCLEQAGVKEAVCALPDGLQTVIGHGGAMLSGGLHQRLLLARALYKDGDVLILDEPATALDPLAERALYEEYGRIAKGKSAVFLSRRLTSTRFCDRIIYLKNGVIAEEGTHDELMAKNGDYARLYHLQSRYYREGRDLDDDIE